MYRRLPRGRCGMSGPGVTPCIPCPDGLDLHSCLICRIFIFLLHVFPFWPPHTPNTEHPPGLVTQRFQSLRGLLRGELHCLTILQAPEALRVQFTLGHKVQHDLGAGSHKRQARPVTPLGPTYRCWHGAAAVALPSGPRPLTPPLVPWCCHLRTAGLTWRPW